MRILIVLMASLVFTSLSWAPAFVKIGSVDASGNIVGRVIDGKVIDENGEVIGKVDANGNAISLSGENLGKVEKVLVNEAGMKGEPHKSNMNKDVAEDKKAQSGAATNESFHGNSSGDPLPSEEATDNDHKDWVKHGGMNSVRPQKPGSKKPACSMHDSVHC